jgi:hypothetical protein
MRAMKAWAWRVGQDHPAYAERVSLSDALADEVIEVVIQHDLLRSFDAPWDPEALKRRALERVEKRWHVLNNKPMGVTQKRLNKR